MSKLQTFKGFFVKGEGKMKNDDEQGSHGRFEWGRMSKFSNFSILKGRQTASSVTLVPETLVEEIEIPLPEGLDDAESFSEGYRETRRQYEERRDEFERNMKV